ncbi:MAG: dTDP-glucose 4,6-dehydratase [Oscillospiraceae bacterium]|jgi:dTDP-glucose 4,6-dehydratase|nr:dTDP-glucose 4,6-dehydratase [Oscillospiraceae bacterium]
MRLIITGGAGFIGANFILYQLENHPEDRLTCFDSLTGAGSESTLSILSREGGFNFVRGDIAVQADVERLFRTEKPDVVVNFAAESHVDRSIADSEPFVRTNVLGAHTLLEACRKYGVLRFHQISTDEVYGDLPLDPYAPQFTEESLFKPSNPYAASKAAADLFALSYHRTYGLPVSITRSSNNFGPHQLPEKLMPRIIRRALADESLPIFGTGLNVRDWIYVRDHCAAIDAVMRLGRTGEVYNVSGGNERTNIDIAKIILRALGKPESLITFVPDRLGHDLRYSMEDSKLRNELGWQPHTSFEKGIRKTVRWYIQNKN